MRHLFLLLTLLALLSSPAKAQQLRQMELHRYDETNSSLAGHTTQILQTPDGLLWIATWNGLCRFDGYEFRRLKPQAGDGCDMTSDRIRDIWLAENDDIYCRSDDAVYRFDTHSYRFCNLTAEEQQHADSLRSGQHSRGRVTDDGIIYEDAHGLQWVLRGDALYCIANVEDPTQPLPQQQSTMVRCIYQDSDGRLWVTTKEDATVRLFSSDGQPQGYLTPDGRLTPTYTSFGAPVYCVTQTTDGHLWLGAKPGGVFRLTDRGGSFGVEHIEGLSNENIYSLAEDSQHRLWVATLGGGIACIDQLQAPQPVVYDQLPGYPVGVSQKVRHLHITPEGVLLAATTEGLIVASTTEADPRNTPFHRHVKEPMRSSSLSCNATMDIAATSDGHLFVSTETGGICQIETVDLLADTLHFRHYNTSNGLLPTDMTIGLTYAGRGHLLVVGNTQIVNLDLYHESYESLDRHFFHHAYRFSEARPLLLDDGRWLIGTLEGALWLPQVLAHRSNYQPPLLLTAINVQKRGTGGIEQLAVNHLDTLRLAADERTVTIHFAALDYTDPQAISYQFRLGSDTATWAGIGHDRSLTLPDLPPGTYNLTLRSTNADGQWTSNDRVLTIIVAPTFWETPWAVLLLVAIALLIVGSVTGFLLYIRRMKRRQQETLDAYLTLLEQNERQRAAESDTPPADPAASTATPASATVDDTDDPFMHRVLAYVEANLSNSDADISQMADACAVSRSVLQRKMKQLMGVTPLDFLREARLKHAAQLLSQPGAHVADVAYRCGFSDPKYFARCFKKSMGMSPSEYKKQ